MRRLKDDDDDDDEDDETGAAPSWDLSALVPALLLRHRVTFNKTFWAGRTPLLPCLITKPSSLQIFRDLLLQSHTSARYL